MAHHDHGHGMVPSSAGRVPARVVRLLTFAVAPLVVATVVGLIALWPRGPVPGSPSRLGPPAKLVNGTVTSVERRPCGGGPATASKCQVAQVRITSGPDKGTTTDLELSVGPGDPILEDGDPVVVGRSADLTGGVFYAFADYQRKAPCSSWRWRSPSSSSPSDGSEASPPWSAS